MHCPALGINMARWSYHWKAKMCQHLQGRTFLLEQRQRPLCLFCAKSKTTQGCSYHYLEALTCLTLRFHGWMDGIFVCGCVYVYVYVCICVSAPQQEPIAMFWLVEVRDTEGLSLPFLPTVPIYTNKIQQDKYGNNTRKHSRYLWYKVIRVTTLLVRTNISVMAFFFIFFFLNFASLKQPNSHPQLHLNFEITFMWQMGWDVTLSLIRPACTSLSDPCAWIHQLIAAGPGAIWNSKLVSVSANAVCVFAHCVPGTLHFHININWHFNLDGK